MASIAVLRLTQDDSEIARIEATYHLFGDNTWELISSAVAIPAGNPRVWYRRQNSVEFFAAHALVLSVDGTPFGLVGFPFAVGQSGAGQLFPSGSLLGWEVLSVS